MRMTDRALRRVAVLALFVLALLEPAFALDIPKYDGPVNDIAGVLDRRDIQTLSKKIVAYRDKSQIEIGVLIIPSLEGASLEDYAHDVFKAWGIGRAEKDNGALFLVATTDRKARIEVGYGLEGALTDLECGRIVSRNSPMANAFRGGDYAGGVAAVIDGIEAGIAGDYEPPEKTDSGMAPPFMLLFISVMFMLALIRVRRRARFGAPGGWTHGPFGGMGLGGGFKSGGSGGGFSFGGGSSGGGGASGGW
jgi:uncharacterized protein